MLLYSLDLDLSGVNGSGSGTTLYATIGAQSWYDVVRASIPKYAHITGIDLSFEVKQNKAGTASIKIGSNTVASISLSGDTSWHTCSVHLTSSGAQTYYSEDTHSGELHDDLRFEATAPSATSLNKANFQFRNASGQISYRTPTVSVQTLVKDDENNVRGTTSGDTTIEIVAPNTSYTANITATPKGGFQFSKWLKDGANFSGNTTNPYTVTVSDSSISAYETTVVYSASMSKKTYYATYQASALDGGTLPAGITATGTDSLMYGAKYTWAISATTGNVGSGTYVYTFDHWKIFKKGDSSGQYGYTTINTASWSRTLDSNSLFANYFDANDTTVCIAYYKRVFFVDLHSPPEYVSYAMTTLTGTAIASTSVTKNNQSYVRWEIPSAGAKLTPTIDERYGITAFSVSSSVATTSVSNGVYTITPVTSTIEPSVTIARIAYLVQLGGETHGAVSFSSSGVLRTGTNEWLISASASATLTANTDTAYDATISLNNTQVAKSNTANNTYTISDGTQDYTFSVTTEQVNFTLSGSLVDGNGDALVSGGTIVFGNNLLQAPRHSSVQVYVTVNTGYGVSDMEVNSTSCGPLTSYTISDLTENTVVTVTLTQDLTQFHKWEIAAPSGGILRLIVRDSNDDTVLSCDATPGHPQTIYLLPAQASSWCIQAIDGNGYEYVAMNCTITSLDGSVSPSNVGTWRMTAATYYSIPSTRESFAVTSAYRKNTVYTRQVESGVTTVKTPVTVHVNNATHQSAARVHSIYIQQPNQQPVLVFEDANDVLSRFASASSMPI